ncbi:MAG: S41 family peptidase [Candidatus Omnitrophica bacterium]|nr:S41 family peptidase [Candidatus Omnitrophota bacterium]
MRKKLIVVSLVIVGSLAFATVAVSGVDRKKRDEWYQQVELFSDALALIQTGYVEQVKPKDLIYGALKGMLASLDPHSQFLDPESYNDLKVETSGEFGGIGIEITIRDGLLTVITPIEGTPAWRAGVKAQDRIVKINDELTRDMTLTDAVKLMRGKPGEPVTITVLREKEAKILEITIVRDVIMIDDIKEARILEDGIGYLRLVEFREDTAEDLDKVLEELKEKGMTGLILDLRNNPGGLLEEAVRVTERFIEPNKTVVFTRGRQARQNIEFDSGLKDGLVEMPMVVLINQGSASGSEIVAGCLQDYKRAVIVGEKSFGKGSVQTVIPLSDGSALRLTTSKYFTPLGNVIHEKGVTPDIEVAYETPRDSEARYYNPAMVERVFTQVEGQEAEPLAEEEPVSGDKEPEPFDYKSDNQILRAIDVLKVADFYAAGDTGE